MLLVFLANTKAQRQTELNFGEERSEAKYGHEKRAYKGFQGECDWYEENNETEYYEKSEEKYGEAKYEAKYGMKAEKKHEEKKYDEKKEADAGVWLSDESVAALELVKGTVHQDVLLLITRGPMNATWSIHGVLEVNRMPHPQPRQIYILVVCPDISAIGATIEPILTIKEIAEKSVNDAVENPSSP
ncbi:hypothetical protein P3T76_013289 [Phytophthora citrophthora]|uniref:Uncharacterized protein n=1 Tax=Phytophthora citrophthora TaxID=4793 RepID=A0AAD9LC94_9STRA|nr:hypothetical protein P3T76_013289 [Phytophthora citrophthora]